MTYENGNTDKGPEENQNPDPNQFPEGTALEQLRNGAFPTNWALIPVHGKATYVEGWSRRKLTVEECIRAYRGDSRYTGLGVVTGEFSGGLIALDIDGPDADSRWRAAIGEEAYHPRGKEGTMAFTSGKRGRRQLLWRVPSSMLPELRHLNALILKEETGTWEEGTGDKNRTKNYNGYQEVVLRFNGCQSVLPGSARPKDYKRYRWLSFNHGEVAPAPRWLIELLLQFTKPADWLSEDDQRAADNAAGETQLPGAQIRGFFFKEEVQQKLMPRLRELVFNHPVFDQYGWIERPGHKAQWLTGCPWHNSSSGTAFQVNPHNGTWYCHACAIGGDALDFIHRVKVQDPNASRPVGKDLESYVAGLVTKLGYSYPDDAKGTVTVKRKAPSVYDVSDLYKKCRKIDKEYKNKEQAKLVMWSVAQDLGFYMFKSGKDIYESYRRYFLSQMIIESAEKDEKELKTGDCLIPDFLRSPSSIMLHARGGLGKTRLALGLARTVGRGETTYIRGSAFTPPTKGKVLLLGSDMTREQYVYYLQQQKIDIDGEDKDWFKLVFDWEVDQEMELIDMLKEFEPKLVIVDSISSVSMNSGYSENDKEYARPIYNLTKYNGTYFNPTCFIWIHHNRKDGTTFRGTDVLRNAVDETWELREQREDEIGHFETGAKILEIGKSRNLRENSKFVVQDAFDEEITLRDTSSIDDRRNGTGDITGPSMVRRIVRDHGPVTAKEVLTKVIELANGLGVERYRPPSLRTVTRWLQKEVSGGTMREDEQAEVGVRGGRPATTYAWLGRSESEEIEAKAIRVMGRIWGATGVGNGVPEHETELERERVQNPPAGPDQSSRSTAAEGISENRDFWTSEAEGEGGSAESEACPKLPNGSPQPSDASSAVFGNSVTVDTLLDLEKG